MILNIVSAKYVAPLSVELQFSDRKVKIVDIGSFIKAHPHPQYNSYLDEKKFKRFKIEMNWDLVFPISALYNGKCD